MEERDEKRSGWGYAVGIVFAFLLLSVLYALSIGPVVMLVKGEPPMWFQVFYYPLAWLASSCKPFQDALNWYMGLWSPA